MKAGKWIGIGILITLGTVALGLAALWLLSGYGFGTMPMMTSWGRKAPVLDIGQCDSPSYGMGLGMMGEGWRNLQCTATANGPSDIIKAGTISDDCVSGTENKQVACPGTIIVPHIDTNNGTLSLNSAYEIVEQYLIDQGDEGLAVGEIMEFENNFYVIVKEEETGLGAMELLVDKRRGIVSPEIGPNIMWNVKYGMHGRGMMVRRSLGENQLSEGAVLRIAQEWLNDNYPGVSIDGHADPFYGYYAIHTLMNGTIEGMLSVHGTTGQVWYHSWHGEFLQMLEDELSH